MYKLNIGSRKKHHSGYTTIDIEEMSGADIIGDFRTMHFEDVDEILAEHLLEHFSREEGEKVLDLWNSWLKPGGKLIVETPDVEGIGREFYYGVVDRYWLTRHLYGSQEAEWAFHRNGFYKEEFERIMPLHGFKIEKIVFNKSRKILPNIRVEAVKL